MILAAVIAGDERVGPILQAIFVVPSAIAETILTCKVFRALIVRSLDDHLSSGARSSTYTMRMNGTSTYQPEESLELGTRITNAGTQSISVW